MAEQAVKDVGKENWDPTSGKKPSDPLLPPAADGLHSGGETKATMKGNTKVPGKGWALLAVVVALGSVGYSAARAGTFMKEHPTPHKNITDGRFGPLSNGSGGNHSDHTMIGNERIDVGLLVTSVVLSFIELIVAATFSSHLRKLHAAVLKKLAGGDNDEDLDGVDTGFAFNRWTAPETERLMQLVKEHGVVSEGSCYSTCKWESVAAGTNRTASGVRDKHVAILKKERDNSGPPRQQPGGGLSLDENEGKVVREERSASGRIRKVVSYDTAAVDQAITGRLCRKWTDTENKKLLQVCVTPHRAATGI